MQYCQKLIISSDHFWDSTFIVRIRSIFEFILLLLIFHFFINVRIYYLKGLFSINSKYLHYYHKFIMRLSRIAKCLSSNLIIKLSLLDSNCKKLSVSKLVQIFILYFEAFRELFHTIFQIVCTILQQPSIQLILILYRLTFPTVKLNHYHWLIFYWTNLKYCNQYFYCLLFKLSIMMAHCILT